MADIFSNLSSQFQAPQQGGSTNMGIPLGIGQTLSTMPTASGYQQAYGAQSQSLDAISNLVNQYLNPSQNVADFTTGLSQINSTANAPGAQQQLTTNIDNTVAGYGTDPNSSFNQMMLKDYNDAKQYYGQVDVGQTTNGTTGMSNIGQLYDAARSQFKPYQELGTSAIGSLSNLQGLNGNDAQNAAIQQLMTSPYVKSQLDLGTKAVNQQAAASGMLRSGNTLQALQAYGQQLASGTIQQQQTNLSNDVALGNQASGSVANLYNQQNAAELARANQLNALTVAPVTTMMNETAQKLQGYGIEQQGQAALQSYLNNYMNTYNNASQAQYTDNYNAKTNYVNDQSAVAAARGNALAQMIYGKTGQPHVVQAGSNQLQMIGGGYGQNITRSLPRN